MGDAKWEPTEEEREAWREMVAAWREQIRRPHDPELRRRYFEEAVPRWQQAKGEG